MIQTVSWAVVFAIFVGIQMFSYHRGRVDERSLWEPRWEMESPEHRMMPFSIDD